MILTKEISENAKCEYRQLVEQVVIDETIPHDMDAHPGEIPVFKKIITARHQGNQSKEFDCAPFVHSLEHSE